MTTPTLELNIKATGIEQVTALRAALADLNKQSQELKNFGSNASSLDRLAQEMKDMRTEVVAAVRDVKTALVDGLKVALQDAIKTVNSGMGGVADAFSAKMKALSEKIASEQQEAARTAMAANGAAATTQARVEGAKVGQAFAQAEEEAKAKVRVSYSVALAGGARASIGANGLSSTDLVMQEAKKVEQSTLAMQAAYDKAIVTLDKQVEKVVEAATVGPNTLRGKGYIAWWDSVISDMEKGEAALLAAYEKSIVTLNKQTAAVMKAATEPAYLAAGPAWWDKVLAEQEAAAAKLEAEYAKEIGKLEKQTAAVMKAATEPAYKYAGPKWWEEVLAEQDAAYAKIVADNEKWTKAIQASVTSANNAAFGGRSGPFSALFSGTVYNMPKPEDLDKVQKGLKGVKGAADEASGAFAHVGSQSAKIRNETGTLLSEIFEGRMANARKSVFALINAFGLFSALFTPEGAVLGGLLALGFAMYKGEEQATAFNNALTLTGGYVGMTRGALEDLARTASQDTSASIGQAKDAVLALAKSGKITGDAMKVLSEDVILQARLTGDSLDAVAADYAKMPDGVAKWAAAHNESMHFMSVAQLEHIRLLEEQGQKEKAMIEVGEALNKHFTEQGEHLGALERAARALRNTYSEMWDAALGVGREKTVEDQINSLQAKIDKVNSNKKWYNITGPTTLDAEVQMWQAQIADLQDQKKMLDQQAAEKGRAVQDQQRGQSALGDISRLTEQTDKATRLSVALVKLKGDIEAYNKAWLGSHPGDTSTPFNAVTKQGYINDAQAAELIRKQTDYINGGSHGNDGALQAAKSEYKDLEALAKSDFANEQALRDDQHRKGLLDNATYFSESLKAQKTYSDQLIDALVDEYDKQLALEKKQEAAINASTTLKAGAKADQIARLRSGLDAWYDTQRTKIDVVTDKAATHLQEQADTSVQAVNKIVEADDKYWAKAELNSKKLADQAKTKRDLASATEEERVQAEAIAKVEDTRAGELEKLQTAYDTAQQSLQAFAVTLTDSESVTPEQAAIYLAWSKNVDVLREQLAKARAEVEKLKGEAAQTALDDLADKKLQQVRNSAKTLSDQLDKGIVDAIFTRGKNTAQKLRTEIENAFLSPIRVVLQAIIQPITNGLVNAGYSMLGMGNAIGTPGSSLIGGLNSASSAYSMAGNIGSAYTVGSQYLAGTMSGANAAGTMYANATGGGLDALLATNGAYGTAAGAAGGAATTFGVVDTAAAAGAAEAGGAMAAAGAASAIPVAGWIAAAAILAYSLFGGKGGGPKTGGYYGATTANPEGQYVGMENSSGAIDSMKSAVDSLTSTYQNYLTTVGGSGGASFGLGMSMDPQGSSSSFVEATARDSNGNAIYSNVNTGVGRDQKDVEAEIKLQGERAVLAALQTSDLPSKVKDYLAKLDPMTASSADIEKAMAITQAVGALDKALAALGPDFTKITNLSIDSESALIAAAGGLDKFNASISSYYQNFYTDSERQSATWAHLQSEFAALNLAMPTTREGFRDMVNGINVSTDEGQKLYAGLINLSGEFASVTQAVTDTGTSLTTLQNNVSDATQKLTDAYNAEKDALTQAHDKFAAFVTSFKDFMKQLTTGDLAGLTPQQKYDATKAQFQTDVANLSSTDSATRDQALAALQQDSQDFLSASRDFFGASQGYYDDLNAVKAAVTQGQNIAQQQADIATQQLAALDQMVSGLITINSTIVASMDAVVTAINNLQAAKGALAQGTAPTAPLPSELISNVNTALQTISPAVVSSNPILSGLVTTWQGLANASQGSFATGLDRVPADGFRATLHQDEMVLNREAASDYRSNRTGISNSLLRTLVQRIESLESTVGEGLAGVIGATHSASDRAAGKIVQGTKEAHSTSNWQVHTKKKAELK